MSAYAYGPYRNNSVSINNILSTNTTTNNNVAKQQQQDNLNDIDDVYEYYILRAAQQHDESTLVADDDVHSMAGVVLDPHDVTMDDYLGSGAFGDVFKGKWREEHVAIKILDYERAEKKLKLSKVAVDETFIWEAQRLESTEHASIVRYFGRTVDPPRLLMEFCSNGTLEQWLCDKHDTLDMTWRWQCAVQLCSGLAYLHNQGMVHRDIKTENVLIDGETSCKWSDLGVSQVDVLLQSSTSQVVQVGLKDYRWASPEETQHMMATAASDIFSFGLLLWRVFSNGEMWKGETNVQTIVHRIRSGETHQYHEFPEYVPSSVRALVSSCWFDDVSKRPSADELLSSLLQSRTDVGDTLTLTNMLVQHHTRLMLHDSYMDRKRFVEPYCTYTDMTSGEWRQFSDMMITSEDANGDDKNDITSTTVAACTVLSEFLDSTNDALVLLGAGGTGKSLTVKVFANSLLLCHDQADSWLPVWIRLGVQPWSHVQLQRGVRQCLRGGFGLNDEEIELLRLRGRLVFIVDGYDELSLGAHNQTLRVLNDDIQEWHSNNCKLVLTCRPHVVPRNEWQLRVSMQHRVMHVQPFAWAQVRAYTRDSQDDGGAMIEKLSTLEFASNPFILRIITQCWPTLQALQERSGDGGSSGTTLRHIYRASVLQFIGSNQGYLSPKVRRELRGEYDSLLTSFEAWAGQLAFRMLCHDVVAFDESALESASQASLWSKLEEFVVDSAGTEYDSRVNDTSSGRMLLSRRQYQVLRAQQAKTFLAHSPIEKRYGSTSFVHKSFLEFFAAHHLATVTDTRVVMDANNNEWWSMQPISKVLLTEQVAVLGIVSQYADASHQSFVDCLFALIEATGTAALKSEHVCRCGANAASILNAAGANFANVEWTDVQLGYSLDDSRMWTKRTPFFCDLAGANLSGAVLTRVNLRGCRLAQACFDQTSVVDCDLSNVMFGQKPSLLGGHHYVTSILVVSDDVLYSGGNLDGSILKWVVADGVCSALNGHSKLVTELVMDPTNERCFYSSSEDCTVRKWVNDVCVLSMEIHTGATCVQVGLEGVGLVVGRDDGFVEFRDLQSGDPLSTVQGDDNYVQSVGVTKQGQVFCGGYDGDIRVYKCNAERNLSFVQSLCGHTSWIGCVLVSSDDLHVYSASKDGSIRVWSTTSYECIRIRPQAHNAYDVRCVVESKYSIFSGGSDHSIREWSKVKRGMDLLRVFDGHTNACRSLALSLDDQTLYSGGDNDGALRQWDKRGSIAMCRPSSGHSDIIQALCLSTDCQKIYSGAAVYDGRLIEWNANTGTLLHVHHGTSRNVRCIVTNEDGMLWSCGDQENAPDPSEENHVGLVQGGKIHEWPHDEVTITGQSAPVYGLVRVRDAYLVSGDRTGNIQLWQKRGDQHLKCVQRLHVDAGVYCVHGDDDVVCCGLNSGALTFWRLSQSESDCSLVPEKTVANAHRATIRSVYVSKSSELILSAGDDGCVCEWMLSGERKRTIIAHNSRIWCVTYSPKHQWVLCGDDVGNLKIYDAQNTQVRSLMLHDRGLLSLVVQGDRVYTAGVDKIIKCSSLRSFFTVWRSPPYVLSARDSVWQCDNSLDLSSRTLLTQLGAQVSSDNDVEILPSSCCCSCFSFYRRLG